MAQDQSQGIRHGCLIKTGVCRGRYSTRTEAIEETLLEWLHAEIRTDDWDDVDALAGIMREETTFRATVIVGLLGIDRTTVMQAEAPNGPSYELSHPEGYESFIIELKTHGEHSDRRVTKT